MSEPALMGMNYSDPALLGFNFFIVASKRNELLIQFNAILHAGLNFPRIWNIIISIVCEAVPQHNYFLVCRSVCFWTELLIISLESWYPFDTMAPRTLEKRKSFAERLLYFLRCLHTAARRGRVMMMKDMAGKIVGLMPVYNMDRLAKLREKPFTINTYDANQLFAAYFPEPDFDGPFPKYELKGFNYAEEDSMICHLVDFGFNDDERAWLEDLIY